MVFSQRHNHRLSRWLAQRYKGILPAGLKAHRKICQPQRTPQKGYPFGGLTFTTAEPWWWIRPLTADTKHKGHPKRGVLLGVEPLPRQSRGGGSAPSPPTPNTKDTPKRVSFVFGAGGGGRTHTVSLPPDFESGTSANSITPAYESCDSHSNSIS